MEVGRVVSSRMYPPSNGAIIRPTYVAEENNDMRSPRLEGKVSAIVASATGTNIAVANP